ncbi:hypothetical protein EJ07DRAFT_32269, partial [Lizonia empirigonia]
FPYEPLDVAKKQFRLLRVGRDGHTDRIGCIMLTVELDSAPIYSALSYTWGPPHPGHQVLVNQETVIIRESLYRVLQQIGSWASRHHLSRHRYLWTDEICIDHQNSAERISQIGLVSEIYSRCHRVLLCLNSVRSSSQTGHQY